MPSRPSSSPIDDPEGRIWLLQAETGRLCSSARLREDLAERKLKAGEQRCGENLARSGGQLGCGAEA